MSGIVQAMTRLVVSVGEDGQCGLRMRRRKPRLRLDRLQCGSLESMLRSGLGSRRS